jgi:hypothetical protein
MVIVSQKSGIVYLILYTVNSQLFNVKIVMTHANYVITVIIIALYAKNIRIMTKLNILVWNLVIKDIFFTMDFATNVKMIVFSVMNSNFV